MTLQDRITVATQEAEQLLVRHGVSRAKAIRVAPDVVNAVLPVLIPRQPTPPTTATLLGDAATDQVLYFAAEDVVWLRALTIGLSELSKDPNRVVYIGVLAGERSDGTGTSQIYAFDLDAMAAAVNEVREFAMRAGVREQLEDLIAKRATHQTPED